VIKVFCAVDFNNAVRVECKVMKSKKDPWISWPSRKPEEGGKWVKQILIKKKVRKIVEKDLLDRYQKMLSEGASDDDDEW
jgi:DNA-binding cell septation regulator SpoVG